MPHVIVIDNFDSFTYNLVDELNRHGATTTVFRNHVPIETLQDFILALKGPKCLLLSPGPDSPDEAGLCLDYVKAFKHHLPIFGICLGHQVIAKAFGGQVYRVNAHHGESSLVRHDGHPLFKDIPSSFEAARYHSLAASCPESFMSLAMTDDIHMAICHQDFPIYGLQFHPESILTENGPQIIQNMLEVTQKHGGQHAA